jgi:hypothetical protein
MEQPDISETGGPLGQLRQRRLNVLEIHQDV